MDFLYSMRRLLFMNPVDYEQTVLKGSTLAMQWNPDAELQIKVSYHDGNAVALSCRRRWSWNG